MPENKTYDTIELKVEPAGTIEKPWPDCDRCIILINGKDILEIIRDAELPYCKKEPDFFEDEAGAYIHMMPTELYEDLVEAEKSNGEEEAPVLCCFCGYSGCASARVKVIKTEDSVIWKDFRTIRDWEFGLSYEFEINQYREFLNQVNNMPLNWNDSKIKNRILELIMKLKNNKIFTILCYLIVACVIIFSIFYFLFAVLL